MIYPVTIIMDRYTGSYSGGEWTAWNLDESDIPIEPSMGDPDAAMFWTEETKKTVGIGNTPNEAFEDLVTKIKSASAQNREG